MKNRLSGWLHYIGPSKLSRRIIYFSSLSFLAVSVWILLLDDIQPLQSAPEGIGWPTARYLWAWSLFSLITAILLSGKIRRAKRAYIALYVSILPPSLLFIDTAIRIVAYEAGQVGGLAVLICIIGGLSILPKAIENRRNWLMATIQRGARRNSLEEENATWDPSYDQVQAEEDLSRTQTNRVWVVLPWIGPAVGMALGGILSSEATDLFGLVLSIFLGFGGLYLAVIGAAIHWLVLSSFEEEIGRPLQLKDES